MRLGRKTLTLTLSHGERGKIGARAWGFRPGPEGVRSGVCGRSVPTRRGADGGPGRAARRRRGWGKRLDRKTLSLTLSHRARGKIAAPGLWGFRPGR